jgi:hypothetical protein
VDRTFLQRSISLGASSVKDLAPICLSSSAVRIAKDAFPCFTGKLVRIFVHDDEAVYCAYERWKGQLDGIAAKIESWKFTGLQRLDGEPAKDLNDLLRIDYDCWEANRLGVESVMSF